MYGFTGAVEWYLGPTLLPDMVQYCSSLQGQWSDISGRRYCLIWYNIVPLYRGSGVISRADVTAWYGTILFLFTGAVEWYLGPTLLPDMVQYCSSLQGQWSDISGRRYCLIWYNIVPLYRGSGVISRADVTAWYGTILFLFTGAVEWYLGPTLLPDMVPRLLGVWIRWSRLGIFTLGHVYI